MQGAEDKEQMSKDIFDRICNCQIQEDVDSRLTCFKNELNNKSLKRVIAVVASVIFDGNKVLSTQRGYGKYNGYWEFVEELKESL